ncbi:dermonecrotic toxin domain-containing protein [Pseudomonas sp. 2835]|uniref:dermonecrotic toxin domain-containing protein n=1 Tax=Pseudomonas sp. 2835 TaxID=3156451 RepID=UPI003D261386
MTSATHNSPLIFHRSLIAAALPGWVSHLRAKDFKALLHSQQHPGELTQSPELEAAFNTAQTTRQALALQLAELKGISDFCRPLLARKLREAYRLDLDVLKAQLHQVGFETIGGRTLPKGGTRSSSLLQAALQNFSDNEDLGPFSYLANEHDQPLDMTCAQFVALCRELDLGKQYQAHLAQVFDTPASAAGLAASMSEAGRAEFVLQVQRARSKGEISEQVLTLLLALASGAPGTMPRLDGKAVVCRQVSVLGSVLDGVLLIGPDPAASNVTERCVAWIAGAPLSALKEYSSTSAFAHDLATSLQGKDYRQAILNCVPQSERRAFLHALNGALYVERYQGDEKILQPILNPRLQVQERALGGELWSRLQRLHVRRLKANARVLAVPTNDEDRAARLARLEHWLDIGLNVLNAAAFVIPALNPLMLVVTGAQLMGNLFHGVQAWEAGETAEAVAQVESLAVNLGLIAALGVAGRAVEPSLFVDGLERIELADGQVRLWKPDLSGYESPVQLPERLAPNALGQYVLNERLYIRLDGKLYEQRYDADGQQWRIRHPHNDHAYEPPLKHYGNGAWQFQGEQPLHWQRGQLLRRIGVLAEGLDDASLAQAADISGVDDDVLRHMHVEQAPLAPLLADTLQRLQLNRRITRMVADVRSGAALEPGMTYPVALLVELPNWPDNRVLQVFKGPELWGESQTYGLERWPQGHAIKLLAADVRSGRLAEVLLQAVSEVQGTELLGEHLPQAEQAPALREQLASLTERRRSAIFDSLYASGEHSPEQGYKALQRDFALLPDSMAQEIVRHASTAERAQLLGEQARVPRRLAEEARAYQRQLRLNRALEGLVFAAHMALDSERLGLQMLAELPGYKSEVRLELHHQTLGSDVLASIGDTDAELRSLLKYEAGYRVFDARGNELGGSDDFFAALLRALPDSVRESLDVHIHESAQLRQRLVRQALGNRARCSILLGQQPSRPWLQSPLRLADGRRGYPLGGALGMLRSTEYQRLKVLYPELHANEITTIKNRLRIENDDLGAAIQRLEDEYRQLGQTLDNWVAQRPGAHERVDREMLRDRLKAAWRRVGGENKHELDLSSWTPGGLPAINARFPHVTRLFLNRMELSAVPESFLSSFTELRALSLEHNRLTEIPATLGNRTKLSVLNLEGNLISANARMFEPLQNLRALRWLNLAGNQMSTLPVEAIHALGSLDSLSTLGLRANGLTLDAGQLQALAAIPLQELDLGRNAIELDEAGAAAFAGLVRLRTLNLADNPLGRAPHLGSFRALEHLNLRACQIEDWPEGLTELMHPRRHVLRTVELSSNELTELPDLAATAFGAALRADGQQSRWLLLNQNPLSEAAASHLRGLGMPYSRSGSGLAAGWLREASAEQQQLWDSLFPDDDTHRPLLLVLDRALESSEASYSFNGMSARVWDLLRAAADSDELFRDLQSVADAYPPTCGDAGADGFSALEVELLVHRLSQQALDPLQRTAAVVGLYKQLYRRDLVNSLAQRIGLARDLRRNGIRAGTRPLPAFDPLDNLTDLDLEHEADPVEIRLRLRQKLADKLDFPEPSSGMLFAHRADVDQRVIKNVEREVLRLSKEVEARQEWMVLQPGWKRYLRKLHGQRFEVFEQQWRDAADYLLSCLYDWHDFDGPLAPDVRSAVQQILPDAPVDGQGHLQRLALSEGRYFTAEQQLKEVSTAAEHGLILELTRSSET